MKIIITQEQVDLLSARATVAMHQEFDEMDEPQLKIENPCITSGMAQHVIEALKTLDGFEVINTDAAEDEQAFGTDAWVYCRAHLAPHLTGWCSVGNEDKIGLGVFGRTPEQEQASRAKCRAWKLTLVKA